MLGQSLQRSCVLQILLNSELVDWTLRSPVVTSESGLWFRPESWRSSRQANTHELPFLPRTSHVVVVSEHFNQYDGGKYTSYIYNYIDLPMFVYVFACKPCFPLLITNAYWFTGILSRPRPPNSWGSVEVTWDYKSKNGKPNHYVCICFSQLSSVRLLIHQYMFIYSIESDLPIILWA